MENEQNEGSEDRRAHRAKCASINNPVEFAADDPTRQAGTPNGVTRTAVEDALARRGRGE